MKVRVELVSLNADGEQQRRQILTIERRELTMETLGMNLTEGKALLSGVQDLAVASMSCDQVPCCENAHRVSQDENIFGNVLKIRVGKRFLLPGSRI